MLYLKPPKTFTNGEIICPEGINRNMLACQETLERFAQKLWRRQIHVFKADSNGIFYVYPLLNTIDYIIERITIYGTYEGSPTLRWSYNVGMTTTDETFALPVNGNEGNYYSGTVIPGTFISGDLEETESGSFTVRVDNATVHDLKVCIAIRTRKGVPGDTTSPIMEVSPVLYEDQTSLTAESFLDNKNTLLEFANDHFTLARPQGLFSAQIHNVLSTTPTYISRRNIFNVGNIKVTRIVGLVELNNTGDSPHTVTVRYGFGTPTNTITVNMDSLPYGSSQSFDTGAISITSSDKFVIQVENSSSTISANVTVNVENIKII